MDKSSQRHLLSLYFGDRNVLFKKNDIGETYGRKNLITDTPNSEEKRERGVSFCKKTRTQRTS